MSSSSNYLATVRVVTFATTIAFSVIVMCLSADLISLTEPVTYFPFAALALSTSLFTILTVIPMYVIDMFRQGSLFSYIVVEIGWLSVLWVLWLSSGSYAAWTDNQLSILDPSESSCSFGLFGDPGIYQACHEIKAIMAFSFLLWILLMAYTVLLLVLSMRAHQQGRPAWTAGVRDGVLLYSSDKTVGSPSQVAATPPTIHQSYPPPPQQSFP